MYPEITRDTSSLEIHNKGFKLTIKISKEVRKSEDLAIGSQLVTRVLMEMERLEIMFISSRALLMLSFVCWFR